jgi:hypothetical protein
MGVRGVCAWEKGARKAVGDGETERCCGVRCAERMKLTFVRRSDGTLEGWGRRGGLAAAWEPRSEAGEGLEKTKGNQTPKRKKLKRRRRALRALGGREGWASLESVQSSRGEAGSKEDKCVRRAGTIVNKSIFCASERGARKWSGGGRAAAVFLARWLGKRGGSRQKARLDGQTGGTVVWDRETGAAKQR